MLSEENDLNSIKIIDFGLSAQNFDLLINNDYCGTYIYMAPELIEKKLYFNSVDMWSIGILMFILLNKGKHPFYVKGDTKREIAKKIKIGKINFYEKISPMAKHLILKLLEPNPSWRYTAIQAIKHPWITRNVNDIPPKTFNEILIRSNNIKILKDLFNTCLFMNFFLKRENFKYLINKKYIQKCAFFSEKNKIKMDKKRERCLNVNTVEDDENNKNPYTGDYDNTKRGKTKEKCFSLLTRNRGKSMKFDKMPKLTFDKRSYKKSKTNGVNDILKKYQSSKIKLNKFKLINQNNILINASRRSIKKSTSQIYKFEKVRHSSIKNYETLTANKNNSIYIYKKINEDSTNEKNNEDFKIKPISSIQDLEKAHKIYQNLSSKKLRNFPKLGNMKKINLFQRNSHISLNNIENSNGVPLILPNLGKLGKTKEKNEKILTKTFMKVQTLK
jgi:serine/threonine protein kinase